MDNILQMLKGGDRRSIGRANEAASRVLESPAMFPHLFEGLTDVDPLIRMRSADAVEKITAQRPELLQPFKKQILDEIALIDQQEVRWHVAQIIPRLALNPDERARAAVILFDYLSAESKIVQVSAMQSLAELAEDDPRLKAQVIQRIGALVQTGSPAVENRGRKLLQRFADEKRR